MSILSYFAILIVICDALTGAAKNHLIDIPFSNVSSAARVIFLLYLFVVARRYNKEFLKFVLVGVGLFSLKYIYYAETPTVPEIVDFFKLMYPFLLCFCLADVSKDKILVFFKAIAIGYISVLFVSHLFNFGITTYKSGTYLGWKGPFYAGNELGLALLIIFSVILCETDLLSRFLQFLLFVALLMIGTKTTIFGSVLVMLGITVFNKNMILNKKVLAVAFVIFCFIAYQYVISFMQKIIDVRDRSLSDSLLYAVYEKRYLTMLKNLNYWSLDFFNPFGIRYYYQRTSFDSVEMDLFDVLFVYGFFITTYIVAIYGYVLRHFKRIDSNNISYALGLLVCMGHSLFAGHVLLSGMVGIPLSFFIAVIIRKQMRSESLQSPAANPVAV